MIGISQKQRRSLFTGLAFLGPNIMGVLLFVVFPVVFSILMAFTNWDLKRHNMWKDETPWFVGLDNFIRLFTEPGFFKYLGNTLFLMMGIPLGIAASLCAALLLSQDTRGGSKKIGLGLFLAAVMIASGLLLALVGMGATAMTLLIVSLICGTLILGTAGGLTVYRTLFYVPSFTAGVATFILWKKLYNPYTGPINQTLQPILDRLTAAVQAVPPTIIQAGMWVGFALIVALFAWCMSKLRRQWDDGDLGTGAALIVAVFPCIPFVVAWLWPYTGAVAWVLTLAAGLVLLWQLGQVVMRGRAFTCTAMEGMGGGLMMAMAVMVLGFILLGLSVVVFHLPGMAGDGLEAPKWISDYNWAKPSIMAMAFWAAIGSNNMLLYLAALTNVPGELYEAADIDGATRFTRFWNITWPQLAPTTFFIAVMAMIGGLQGGFEMARTMTKGGPAGATTTLSYFVYLEGFQTGQLGYACAVAWVLFLLVLSVTAFNWTFGNRYVNE